MENQEEKKELSQDAPNNEERRDDGSKDKSGASFIALAIVILVVASAVTLFAIMWGKDSEVLAMVNGDEVTMTDIQPSLERIKEQYRAQGVNISEEEGMEDMLVFQALQNHIQQKLLLDYAKEHGLEVSREQVQNEIAEVKADFDGDEQFEMALAQAGLTEDDFEEQIKLNLTAHLVAEKEGVDKNIPEEDTQSRYDQYSAHMGDEMPPLEEVRREIEQEIMNERVDGVLQVLIEKLREDGDIQLFVEMPQPPAQPQMQMQEGADGGEGMTEEEIMEMMMEQMGEQEATQ